MADELSEGRFTTDGSYAPNALDPLATHDSWLSGVSKSSIKAARLSKQRMEEDQRKREELENKGEETMSRERDDCLIALLALVREGETVMGALARLGVMMRKRGVVRQKQVRKPKVDDSMEVDGDTSIPATASPSVNVEVDPITKKIDQLTHLASTLLSSHGELEIYDQSYADIISTLKKEGAVRRDWVPAKHLDVIDEDESMDHQGDKSTTTTNATGFRSLIKRPTLPKAASPVPTPAPATISSSTSQFFYKWLKIQGGAQSIDEEYGPYPRSELEGWIKGGYFGVEGERVLVRKVGGDGFKSWVEISR